MPAAMQILLSSLLLLTAIRPAAAEDDVAYETGLQWGLDRIGARDAWQVGRGAGITIAVIDSGVALDHEDLAEHLVPGTACRNTSGDPDLCNGSAADHDGHGTHVAGIAAAVTGNGVGIAGTAPDALLMPIKVLFAPCDTCPSAGNAEDVAAAVRWAARHGAQVINLSLGSTMSSVFGPGFAEALDEAWQLGAIPVVAAGNDVVLSAELGEAPAVIVSATDRSDEAPEYSSGVGDARWAIAAPGGDGYDTAESCAQDGAPRGILSTYWAPDDQTSAYACLSGTSMAAPYVSGALAILLGTGLTPPEAVQAMLDSAVDLGEPGPDDVFGAGRLDIAAATVGLRPLPVPAGAPARPDQDRAVGEVSNPQRFDAGAPDREPVVAAAFAAVLATVTGAAAVAVWRGRRRPGGSAAEEID